MRFRVERDEAELLDPRAGFERRRIPLEVRFDPLTGHTSRVLPHGSFGPPARLDLAALAEQTREGCPFCAERVGEATPRFPPELVPEGRIRRGEALLFPNLAAYARWSAVSIYSPGRHALALEEVTAELLAGNLAAQVEFARAVRRHDPAAAWSSVNANHLPPSGSSILHPHLQGIADPSPTTMQRLLAEVPRERFRAYVDRELELGERRLGSTGAVEWLAAFAPLGPAEVRAVVFDAHSPADLDEPLVEELARGISATLRLYAALGFQSFNLALYGAPESVLSLRLVARGGYGPLARSDAMWSERVHWEAAVDVVPETLAETAALHGFFGASTDR